MTVTDDGVGLPQDWSRPGHFGLRGLAERVEHLGGKLNCATASRAAAELDGGDPAGGERA